MPQLFRVVSCGNRRFGDRWWASGEDL